MAQTIAIFDLDRTITRYGTFTPYLLYACKIRPWRLLFLPVTLLFMLAYKLRLLTRTRLKEIMIYCFLSGLSRPKIDEISARFTNHLLRSGCRKGALDAIKNHKKSGDRLVMATASMDFYATVIGAALDFDKIVATRAVWSEKERILAKIDGENCYGQKKLTEVKDSLVETVSRSGGKSIIFYTDHHSDQPMLDWCTLPIAVNPSRKLRILAQQRGWKCVDWDDRAARW